MGTDCGGRNCGLREREPLAGMEERIVAKIRAAQGPQRRLQGWAWLWQW